MFRQWGEMWYFTLLIPIFFDVIRISATALLVLSGLAEFRLIILDRVVGEFR